MTDAFLSWNFAMFWRDCMYLPRIAPKYTWPGCSDKSYPKIHRQGFTTKLSLYQLWNTCLCIICWRLFEYCHLLLMTSLILLLILNCISKPTWRTNRRQTKIHPFSVFISYLGGVSIKNHLAANSQLLFFWPKKIPKSPILQERKKDLDVRYRISHQGLFSQQNIHWISLFHFLRLVL